MIAIEPNPATVERLRASITLNRLGNVQIEAAAVGDASGQVEFFVAADSAYSGLQSDERSPATATTTTAMVTLDSVWSSAGRPLVALLKLESRAPRRGRSRARKSCSRLPAGRSARGA